MSTEEEILERLAQLPLTDMEREILGQLTVDRERQNLAVRRLETMVHERLSKEGVP